MVTGDYVFQRWERNSFRSLSYNGAYSLCKKKTDDFHFTSEVNEMLEKL